VCEITKLAKSVGGKRRERYPGFKICFFKWVNSCRYDSCYSKLVTNLADGERVVGFHYVGRRELLCVFRPSFLSYLSALYFLWLSKLNPKSFEHITRLPPRMCVTLNPKT
jgi:hypothetical protein